VGDRVDGEGGRESNGPMDEHLAWLNEEKARKVFNLGRFSLSVSRDRVVVRGKVGEEWGREQVFDRGSVETSVTPVSRSSQHVLYAGFAFYLLGYLTLFVVDGLRTPQQLYVFGISLLILLLPLIFYITITLKPFLVFSAAFYLVLFSLPVEGQLGVVFQVVEDMVGAGYVESFFVGASMLPIIMHVIVKQTLVRYDFWLVEENKKFHTRVAGRVAPVAESYIRNWSPPGRRFSPGRFMWFDFQHFFLRLSKNREKSCLYCGRRTLVECNRCHTPVCNDHFEVFRGYKVCLDCWVDTRGNLGELRRRMNR